MFRSSVLPTARCVRQARPLTVVTMSALLGHVAARAQPHAHSHVPRRGVHSWSAPRAKPCAEARGRAGLPAAGFARPRRRRAGPGRGEGRAAGGLAAAAAVTRVCCSCTLCLAAALWACQRQRLVTSILTDAILLLHRAPSCSPAADAGRKCGQAWSVAGAAIMDR